VWALIGAWGCKGANQVPGAESCHQDLVGKKMKRGAGDTRTKVEKKSREVWTSVVKFVIRSATSCNIPPES
jgi:hypothetical protein